MSAFLNFNKTGIKLKETGKKETYLTFVFCKMENFLMRATWMRDYSQTATRDCVSVGPDHTNSLW